MNTLTRTATQRDRFHAFDLLELRGRDCRTLPLIERLSALVNLLGPLGAPSIPLVNTAYGEEYKRRLFAELRCGSREGVVFKRLDAHYTPGRTNRGGTALKHKFTATLSAVVERINAHRTAGPPENPAITAPTPVVDLDR